MHKEEPLRINNDDEVVWDTVVHSGGHPEMVLDGSGVRREFIFRAKNPLEGELYRADWYGYGIKGTHPEVGVEEYFLKRPLDVVLSSLGIVLSFPLWVVIAVVIWLEDGGTPFFCSERVGKRGRAFKHVKFRTMFNGSDKLFGPLQTKENDHRVTRVGKLLRATAMDEVPQLWNILKGDMTFVGPRPLLPSEIEVGQDSVREAVSIEEIPGYRERHSVTPGLTGIAQIFAPRDIIRRRKFHYDLFYIRRQSLSLDVRLILLSFWITVRGRWESRGKKL